MIGDNPTGETVDLLGKLNGVVDRAAAALYQSNDVAAAITAYQTATAAYAAGKKLRMVAKKKMRPAILTQIARIQADALAVRADAECRIADDYDAAQARGDVTSPANYHQNPNAAKAEATYGIDTKALCYARRIRDAERKDPGFVRRLLNRTIAEDKEPSTVLLREAARQATRGPKKTRLQMSLDTVKIATAVRTLKNEWNSAKMMARQAFLYDLGLDDQALINKLSRHDFGMKRMLGEKKKLLPIDKLPVVDGDGYEHH